MVIVDSSVWIDYLNRRLTPETRWLQAAQNIEEVGLTTLVLAEVLQGIRFDNRFRSAEHFFRTLQIFESLTTPIGVQSARNYRTLRGHGVTVRSTIDCLIATFCIENGFRLLESDSDFEPFERYLGLNVVHP